MYVCRATFVSVRTHHLSNHKYLLWPLTCMKNLQNMPLQANTMSCKSSGKSPSPLWKMLNTIGWWLIYMHLLPSWPLPNKGRCYFSIYVKLVQNEGRVQEYVRVSARQTDWAQGRPRERKADRESARKMSAGGASKKSIQVKYKKISFKDLEFDQGDDVSVLDRVFMACLSISWIHLPSFLTSVFRERSVWWRKESEMER